MYHDQTTVHRFRSADEGTQGHFILTHLMPFEAGKSIYSLGRVFLAPGQLTSGAAIP